MKIDELVGGQDLALLHDADRAAAKLLASHGAVIGETDPPHYEVFEALAAKHSPDLELEEARLKEFDRLLGEQGRYLECFPSDVACDRWTAVITAAYYLGLCVGWRLQKEGGE